MLRGFPFIAVENGGEIAYTMSVKEKLLKRLLSRPKDFTYEEAVTLLRGFGYVEDNKGRTSGSRVMFYNEITHAPIMFHKPHPKNILLDYAIKELICGLVSAGLISKGNK